MDTDEDPPRDQSVVLYKKRRTGLGREENDSPRSKLVHDAIRYVIAGLGPHELGVLAQVCKSWNKMIKELAMQRGYPSAKFYTPIGPYRELSIKRAADFDVGYVETSLGKIQWLKWINGKIRENKLRLHVRNQDDGQMYYMELVRDGPRKIFIRGPDAYGEEKELVKFVVDENHIKLEDLFFHCDGWHSTNTLQRVRETRSRAVWDEGLGERGWGKFILYFIDYLCEELELRYAELVDAASITIKGKSVNLYYVQMVKHGKGYYESVGYYARGAKHDVFNEILDTKIEDCTPDPVRLDDLLEEVTKAFDKYRSDDARVLEKMSGRVFLRRKEKVEMGREILMGIYGELTFRDLLKRYLRPGFENPHLINYVCGFIDVRVYGTFGGPNTKLKFFNVLPPQTRLSVEQITSLIAPALQIVKSQTRVGGRFIKYMVPPTSRLPEFNWRKWISGDYADKPAALPLLIRRSVGDLFYVKLQRVAPFELAVFADEGKRIVSFRYEDIYFGHRKSQSWFTPGKGQLLKTWPLYVPRMHIVGQSCPTSEYEWHIPLLDLFEYLNYTLKIRLANVQDTIMVDFKGCLVDYWSLSMYQKWENSILFDLDYRNGKEGWELERETELLAPHRQTLNE